MIPVAIVTGGVIIHEKHKREREDRELIQQEIDRRAMPVPTDLAAGAERHGSWFFPITPAPERLLVHYLADAEERTLVVDLSAISTLHIKPAAAPREQRKR
jgi:hypothetical protein